MIERPEERIATEHPDEATGRAEGRPTGGLSTADIAGGRTPMKSDDRPDGTGAQAARANTATGAETPLFDRGDAESFRSRWTETQTGFVDDPRRTVEQADELVAEVMKRLAEVFANERSELEGQWSRGEDVDTESLRVALQRYRSFFDRLLSV